MYSALESSIRDFSADILGGFPTVSHCSTRKSKQIISELKETGILLIQVSIGSIRELYY